MKKMRMLLVSLLLLILVLIFPQKVSAYESTICKMYYYDLVLSNDGTEELKFSHYDFEFIGDFSEEEKALVIYTNLLEMKGIRFLPENTGLLWVNIAGNTLFLNVSKEIKEINGGAAQTHLLNQLIENAKQFGVSYFTLLVEGQMEYLSEGIISDKIILR